ncbi:MAG: carboxypeptidase regulatory-like domain-containing protein [Phycisphaerae bacterium]
MTKKSQNNDWLDEAISKAICGQQAIPDFEKWKSVHPSAVEYLRAFAGKTKNFTTWRMVMKNRITKLAVAAIILAVISGIYHFNGSIDGANTAFAQVVEAFQKMSCMRMVGTKTRIREKAPRTIDSWTCFDTKTKIVKDMDGKVSLWNYETHEQFEYSPDTGKITVSQMPEGSSLKRMSPSDLVDELIQMGKKKGSTIERKEGTFNGSHVEIFDLTMTDGQNTGKIQLRVDPQKNLPIAGEWQTFEFDVNVDNMSVRFEYPQNAPKDLYDVGVPRTAEIVRAEQPMIRGRLVNAKGQPVKGIVDFGVEKPLATNESGEFSFLVPAWFNDTMQKQIGYARNLEKTLSRGFLWGGKKEQAELKIVLEPSVRITGRVVDAESRGLDDAKVELWVAMPSGGWTNISNNPWQMKKEGEGRFTFEDVPVGLPMDVHAEKPGFQGRTPMAVVAGATTVTLKDIVLKPLPGFEEKTQWNARLSGRVLDEKGNPMPRLEVHIGVGTITFNDTTNSRGEYTLTGLPQGKKIQGSVYADGYGHTMFRVVCDTPNKNFDIQIFPQGYELCNKPAPGLFVEKWLNSPPITLEQYRGKVVLLQIGVYLQTSTQELEKMKGLLRRYGDKGLEVIAVHMRLENLDWAGKVTEEMILDFIKSHDIKFPFGIDDKSEKVRDKVSNGRLVGNGAMYALYNVKATPALYLIDKKGIVRISPKRDDINEWIEKLLAE